MSADLSVLVARELVNAHVLDSDGRKIGRVVDLVVDVAGGWKVVEIELGSHGWLDRLDLLRPLFHGHAGHEPQTVAWSDVDHVDRGRIILRQEARIPD